MKRVIIVLLLAFSLCGALFSQTVWQGRVARGGSQDFPSEGFYAASNSFARNSIVTVTNPANGKNVRVVISRGLSDNSLFMTLSADAAKALGLDGNFPATMKAQPVIIPGISDQSIGSELPFSRDPDINPAAGGNDIVTDNQTPAQDTRAASSDGQAAIADNQQVNPADLDLSGSALIGSPQDKLPTDVQNQNARSAGSQAPVAAANSENPNLLQAATTTPVAPSSNGEIPPSNTLAGQPAALSDATPATARSAQSANTDNLGAALAPASQQGTVNPASTQAVDSSSPNNLNAASSGDTLNGSSDSAIARGIASSMGNLKGNQPLQAGTANTPANAKSGALAAGVEKLGGQRLGQAGRKPASTTVEIPGAATGVGTGLRSIGDGERELPNTGDISRPEHLFAPMDSQVPQDGTNQADLSLPLLHEKSTVAPNSPAGVSDSLLEKQLAAINERNAHRQLYEAPHQDSDTAMLPGLQAATATALNPKLPAAVPVNGETGEPSLAGVNAQTGIANAGTLPTAKANDGQGPEASNPWLDGSTAINGTTTSLPVAQLVPGEVPQAAFQGAGPGVAFVPDKSDLPLVTLKLSDTAQPAFSALSPNQQSIAAAQLPAPLAAGSALPDDPLKALRPVQTFVSLEPADYRPPQIPAPDSDRVLANPPLSKEPDGRLVAAQVHTGQGPDASTAMLEAMRPQSNLGDTSLAAPSDRTMPDLLTPGTAPAVAGAAEPDLAQARNPEVITNDAGLSGLSSPSDNGSPVAVTEPHSPTAEDLLPGQKLAIQSKEGNIVVNPALPGTKTNGVSPNTVTVPQQGEPEVFVGNDEQWAQKNLPMVKKLQREKYYLQVGAFANPHSAKSAIGVAGVKFPVAVIPEKAASKAVYKVFIGPLNEDEKGIVLYLFRAKGFRDAFIKKGQP